MSPITTHVLDTMQGKPASGVPIVLSIQTEENQWKELARGVTNTDGRISDLLPDTFELTRNRYLMTFDTATYFHSIGIVGFYPSVAVIFELTDPFLHYHIPLLLSPYGYSTYRGS